MLNITHTSGTLGDRWSNIAVIHGRGNYYSVHYCSELYAHLQVKETIAIFRAYPKDQNPSRHLRHVVLETVKQTL
jgi:hypothetical protein